MVLRPQRAIGQNVRQHVLAGQKGFRLHSIRKRQKRDIKFAYNGQRIVFFDFSRSNEDRINYDVIESIKNGMMFSTKYESVVRMYDHPHVIIFANFMPSLTKLSADRWDVRTLQYVQTDRFTGVRASEIDFDSANI